MLATCFLHPTVVGFSNRSLLPIKQLKVCVNMCGEDAERVPARAKHSVRKASGRLANELELHECGAQATHGLAASEELPCVNQEALSAPMTDRADCRLWRLA